MASYYKKKLFTYISSGNFAANCKRFFKKINKNDFRISGDCLLKKKIDFKVSKEFLLLTPFCYPKKKTIHSASNY